MKKVFLIIVVALFSLNIFAQSKISSNNLVGFWEPDKHSSNMVFWLDAKHNLQMVEFDTMDGVPLRLLSMKIINDELVVKTICDEKNWEIESTYTFINKNTLQCIIKGPINGLVTYTKIK
jgi:hypothetical protein